MRHLPRTLLLTAAFLLPAAPPLPAGPLSPDPERTEILLARGTRWETRAYLARSTAPGPTVVIVGGVHGNEPAGARAAEEIRTWPIVRGKLLVIPRANARGLEAGKRRVPDTEPYDLNRRFPSAKSGEVTGPLARSIWKLVSRLRPDWFLDLHESGDYRYRTSKKKKTLGNTLICYPGAETERVAKLMAGAASELIGDEKKRWVLLRAPIEGSIARAVATRLGARSMIAETTSKDHLAVRIRHHRFLAHRLLRELGMLPRDLSPYTMFGGKRRRGEIRVALYNGPGTGPKSACAVERCLPPGGPFRPRRISAPGIRAGALAQFDVVVFPGGTGSGTARCLGRDGRRAVRSFVKAGGGCLGVCAGAYLLTRHYAWSLHLLDARVLDTEHWARGRGTVTIRLTPAGRRLFAEKRTEVKILYHQGPLLAPGKDPAIPDFEVLAEYRTEVAENGAPRGVMIGAAALVRGAFGKGRVLAMSPHPESTEGLHAYLPRAISWLAGTGAAVPPGGRAAGRPAR